MGNLPSKRRAENFANRDTRGNIDSWYNTFGREHDGGLVYLSVALLGECNLNCDFCYVDGSRPSSGGWDKEDLFEIIDDAIALGMEKIQLSGGEPLLYKPLFETINYLHEREVEILLVTNATYMTPEIAQYLKDNEVLVGISLETHIPELEDEIVGVPGTFSRKMEAIQYLKAVGYTSEIPINIIMKTMRKNYDTFIDTWRWALDQQLQPVLDRAIPGVRLPIECVVTPQQLRHLMDEIGVMQGVKHIVPFLGNEACDRLECGIHIETNGDILPCAGVNLPVANVLEKSLADVWLNNLLLKECKTHTETIEGSCGSCDYAEACTGCRGVAFEIFGDINAPDPLCFHYDPDDSYCESLHIDEDGQVNLVNSSSKPIRPAYEQRLIDNPEEAKDYMGIRTSAERLKGVNNKDCVDCGFTTHDPKNKK